MSKGFISYYDLMSEEAEPTSFVLSFRKPGEGQSIGSGVRGRGGVKETGAKIKIAAVEPKSRNEHHRLPSRAQHSR